MSFTLHTYPDKVGTRVIECHTVTAVAFGTDAPQDIVYQRYTKSYSGRNSRPYKTAFASYSTLEAAVKALVKAGGAA